MEQHSTPTIYAETENYTMIEGAAYRFARDYRDVVERCRKASKTSTNTAFVYEVVNGEAMLRAAQTSRALAEKYITANCVLILTGEQFRPCSECDAATLYSAYSDEDEARGAAYAAHVGIPNGPESPEDVRQGIVDDYMKRALCLKCGGK